MTQPAAQPRRHSQTQSRAAGLLTVALRRLTASLGGALPLPGCLASVVEYLLDAGVRKPGGARNLAQARLRPMRLLDRGVEVAPRLGLLLRGVP